MRFWQQIFAIVIQPKKYLHLSIQRQCFFAEFLDAKESPNFFSFQDLQVLSPKITIQL
jgi:hypothetical protein